MTELKEVNVNGKDYVLKSEFEELQKKERDYVVLDPANVLALGKIQNLEDKSKPLHLLNDFNRITNDIRLMVDLKNPDVIEIFKGDIRWSKISKEYYDKAVKIINLFKGEPVVYLNIKENYPVLIAGDDLGLVLAPRIDDV